MSGKKRQVYFYEPIVLDKKDKVQPLPNDFWGQLHAHAKTLSATQRHFEHFGRFISGEARTETTPSADYIYLDRERPIQDWPDARDNAGSLATLASHGTVMSLHEPAYLLPVSRTNYIAMVRSSGGPSTSAIARWLNLAFGFGKTDEYVDLRAVTRGDQMKRLADAQLASKIHLRVAPGALTGQHLTGQIGQALEAAQNVSTGSVSVDLTIRFGNAKPDDAGGQAMVADVRELMNANAPFKKAVANVIVDGPNGELIRDTIDFTRDRITLSQEIGHSEDDDPTPEIVLDGMLEAIKRFRKLI